MKKHCNHNAVNRRGAFAVIAIVALVLSGFLMAGAMKIAIAHRRQVQAEQYRAQADWLAESGLERAVAQHTANPAYRGETWNVNEKELAGRHTGQVTITLTPKETPTQIKVTAVYPAGQTKSAKRTLTLSLPAPAVAEGERE